MINSARAKIFQILKNKMKYFVYCRKSTSDDTHQAQSIETQNRILKDFVRKNKLQVVDYIFETRSAKDDGNRPQFENMLKRFEKHEADGLIVCHIDRISRNWIEAGQIAKLHDLEIIKEIRTPSKTYSTVNDLFMMGIELASATYYSRNLSIRVKEGNATKIAKGEYLSIPPLGYVYKDRHLIPDPKTANFVRHAYELCFSGSTTKQITNILYSEGLRTRRGGNKVSQSTVHRILTNPLFYGYIKYKNQLYKGVHEALVSKYMFERIQELLTGRSTTKKYKHSFLYSGYLTCDICGCLYTASVKKQKYNYYYCTNGRHVCNEHLKYQNEEILHGVFANYTNKFTQLDEEMANLSLEIYLSELKDEKNNFVERQSLIKDQIKNQVTKKNKLLDIYLSGDIPKDEYDSKRLAIQESIDDLQETLENKLDDSKSTLELFYNIKNDLFSLESTFRYGSNEVKSEILKSLLWNCKMQNGKIQSVRLKEPYLCFEKLSKSSNLEEWRVLWDSNPRSSA